MSESTLRLDFIVGMSRTGITWLTRALNLHPALTTFGQSRFWGKHYREPADPRGYDQHELARMHRRLRSFTWDATVGRGPGCLDWDLDRVRASIDEAWAQLVAPVRPARAFEVLAGVFARAGGSTHVLEKTPHHVLHVDRIRAHLPRARFVIITADAHDYAAIQREQIDLPYHPIAVALLYRRYADACQRAARMLGDEAVRVELRALMADPDRALMPVFRLLDVEPISVAGRMPALNPFAEPARSIDRFWLATLANAGRGSTPSAIELGGSLLSLPGWALGNLRNNIEDVEGPLLRYYAKWLWGRR
jgi:hypothetical protein